MACEPTELLNPGDRPDWFLARHRYALRLVERQSIRELPNALSKVLKRTHDSALDRWLPIEGAVVCGQAFGSSRMLDYRIKRGPCVYG